MSEQRGIYLSHADADVHAARILKRWLRYLGYQVYSALDDVQPGENLEVVPEKKMAQAALSLLCISNGARNEKGRCQKEWNWIRDRLDEMAEDDIFAIPIMLEPGDSPFKFKQIQSVKLFEQGGFERLRLSLNRLVDQNVLNNSANESGKVNKDFRVMLLSTDADLGKYRYFASEHIEQALPIEVIEGSAQWIPPAGPFDMTVLIQAWRWENGHAAQFWKKAPADRRALVRCDPEATPWHSAKYLELHEMDAIDGFCEAAGVTKIFTEPDTLPNQIREIIEERYQRIGDGEKGPVGLTDIEREYLTMRVKTWRQGRAGGKGFETSKFYEPDLYVPLDGVSGQWRFGENGRLERRPEGKDQAAAMGRELLQDKHARAPLNRWATQAQLPWLALTGAPGGGKTVFLTRFAADLADFLLGRLGEKAFQTQSQGLRLESGWTPLPVTLEATKLAHDGKPALDVLATAVAEELGAATAGQKPRAADVEPGLRAGRYLLLIDALDEIAVAEARRNALQLLKDLKDCLGPTRVLLTTRSARYTGEMTFGPEFETLSLAPLNPGQVEEFCRRFAERKGELPAFQGDLNDALQALDTRIQGEDEDSFSSNPLLLSTACSVFQRLRLLPDDRAELCERLVTDLCGARRSEDEKKGWRLDPSEKRRYLERLALRMQESGAQTLAERDARAAISQDWPADRAGDRVRIEAYLKWLAEHTGLIYFAPGEEGGENVRFHHRLFREYLAASRLTRDNIDMKTLVGRLWKDKRLVDPFWLDVMRLLPGAFNSEEKAAAIAAEIQALARRQRKARGRLWGVLAAMMVENPNLFENWPRSGAVTEMTASYEKEAASWDLEDRRLLLEGVGALGDPRLDPFRDDRWVFVSPGRFTMGDNQSQWDDEKPEHPVEITRSYWLGRFPVTNAEYRRFVEDEAYKERRWWSDAAWDWLRLEGPAYDAWFEEWWEGLDYISNENKEKYREDYRGYCRPSGGPAFWRERRFNGANQPVVGVNWHEANAYCRWLAAKLKDDLPKWLNGDLEVGLPGEGQWEFAARGEKNRAYPWGNKPAPNRDLANYESHIGHTTPVGLYPLGATPGGLLDMAGNVWEWQRNEWHDNYKKCQGSDNCQHSDKNTLNEASSASLRPLRGGAWRSDADYLRGSFRLGWGAWSRGVDIGFRCCLRSSSPEHG